MSHVNSKNSYEQLVSAYFGRESDTVLSTKNQFPLIGSMFEKCSVYYDKDSNSLILADNDRIFKCCLDGCSSSIDFCHKNCYEKHGDESINTNNTLYKRCRERCNIISEDCVSLCSQARKLQKDNDPFIKEAIKIGCWDTVSNKPRPECIKDNEKHLTYHCMKKCFPTANINCTEQCNTSYNLATDPKKVSKIFENNIYHTSISDNIQDKDSKSDSLLYILIGLSVGILLAIIVMIFIFKTK